MSLEATRAAWAAPVSTPVQRLVLLALADACRRGGRKCWPSHKRLQQVTLLPRKAVRAALQGLVARGILRDTGERRGTTSRVVVYEILNEVPTGLIGATRNGVQHEPIHGASNGVAQAPIPAKAMGSLADGNGVQTGPLNGVETDPRNQEVESGRIRKALPPPSPTRAKGNGNGVSSPTNGNGQTLATWATAYGITQSRRETDDAYKRRCIDAFVKWKAAQGTP